jgi:hypothetical protein
LNRGDRKELVVLFDSGLAWPNVASPNVEKQSEKKQLAATALATVMKFGKLIDPEASVPLLGRISNRLRMGGGYSNYVVADAAQRFAIMSLMRALVSGSKSPDEVTKLSAYLGGAFPTENEWIQLLEQELSLGAAATELRNVPSNNFLKKLFVVLGEKSKESVYVRIGGGEASSTKLLAKRDIAALAQKMAQTETYRMTHLAGFAFYLKNGGDLNNLDPDDVREFRKIFAKSPQKFGSPLLGINEVNCLHLKSVADDLGQNKHSAQMIFSYE